MISHIPAVLPIPPKAGRSRTPWTTPLYIVSPTKYVKELRKCSKFTHAMSAVAFARSTGTFAYSVVPKLGGGLTYTQLFPHPATALSRAMIAGGVV